MPEITTAQQRVIDTLKRTGQWMTWDEISRASPAPVQWRTVNRLAERGVIQKEKIGHFPVRYHYTD